jgi:DNA polymerase-3 subunit epsilon
VAKLLGIDFETTGLSADTNRPTEVGAVLWCTERESPLLIYNALIDCDDVVSDKITQLTGIDRPMLDEFGVSEGSAALGLHTLVQGADFMVAHNAPFDKRFMVAMYARQNLAFPEAMRWIDSSKDIPYPEHITTRKLVHLAAEHGFVNPFAHRAITDVLTMLRIVSKYDINEIVSSAGTPNILIRAQVTFDSKEKAKGLGFRWDGDKKIWTKEIKKGALDSERAKCEASGFYIQEMTSE